MEYKLTLVFSDELAEWNSATLEYGDKGYLIKRTVEQDIKLKSVHMQMRKLNGPYTLVSDDRNVTLETTIGEIIQAELKGYKQIMDFHGDDD